MAWARHGSGERESLRVSALAPSKVDHFWHFSHFWYKSSCSSSEISINTLHTLDKLLPWFIFMQRHKKMKYLIIMLS